MVTRTEVICDVIGCKEDAYHSVDCCSGWTVSDGNHETHKKYKKFEKPLKESKRDLCGEHWKKWSIATCKLLKMDKGSKE